MKKQLKTGIKIALPLIVFLAISFYLFIQYRTGPDYTQHFARLLPPETAAFASLQDFSTIWNQVSSLKVTSQIMESEELSYLLVSSEDIQDWKKNLSEIEYKTRMDLGKDFILKWLGQDVAVALVPPGTDSAPPGILVMSKTRIGFEEKLAELVALYYPDLNLETESWKGVSIHRYRGKKEYRSFAYLRFGRTVILSLRSSDISLLQKIVDLKKDKDLPCLHGSQHFKLYLASPEKKAGISLFAHTERMIDFLKSSQRYSESEILQDMLPIIGETFKPYSHMQINIHLEKGLKGELGFYYNTPPDKILPPPAEFQSLTNLPDNTSLFLGLKDANLSNSMKTILRFFFKDEKPPENNETGLPELERLLDEQVFPNVKNEFTVSLVKMEPGLVTPLMSGDIFLEIKEPQNTEKELRNIFESMGAKKEDPEQKILTPIGTLGYSVKDDFVRIKVRAQPDDSQDVKPESGLSSNPLFRELLIGGMKESHVVIYINFERVSEDLEELAKRSIRWNDKTRERVKRFKKWAGVCRYLKGCAVQDKRDEKAILYNIRIPVE